MSTWLWIALVLAVLIVAVLVATASIRRRRSHILQEGFGPEYDLTVDRAGSQAQAEAELRERQRRREELELRPLAPIARRRGYRATYPQISRTVLAPRP